MRVGVSVILLLVLFVGSAWAEEDAATEAALGLTRADRRVIQSSLAAEGFDPGPADGLFGPRTRAAIGGWQGARGEEQTGYLNAETARLLLDRPSRRRNRQRRGRLLKPGWASVVKTVVRFKQASRLRDSMLARQTVCSVAGHERRLVAGRTGAVQSQPVTWTRKPLSRCLPRLRSPGARRRRRPNPIFPSKIGKQRQNARDKGSSAQQRRRRNARKNGSSVKRRPNVRSAKDNLGRNCVIAKRVRKW